MEPTHIRKAAVALLVCSSLFFGAAAPAQESPPAETGIQWGGALETGYRFTDIHGSSDRYREVVNLDEGPNLFDLNLWVKDLERKGFADEVRLRLSSIGDPFPSARLDIKKNKLYQLSVDYREYDFFFNRLDTPADSLSLLTDNHDFDQKRRTGRILLSLFPGEEIRLNFGHNFAQRTGEAAVPRAFIPVANLPQDLDEQFREYFGSIDFPLGGWDFHVKQSFWTFDNENEIDQAPTLLEKRDESVWTYVSTLKGHTQLGERWDLDAGYVYAHSEGSSRLEVFPPVFVDSGTGELKYDTHIVELGLSHLLRKDLIAHLDYRLHTFEQHGQAITDFLQPPPFNETDYSLFAHTLTPQLEYLPFDHLTLRGGYRFQYRSIEAENFAPDLADGGQSSQGDKVLSHSWVASFDWKPIKSLSLFGEYEGDTFNIPYTRISPEEQHIAKFRIRYDTPIKGLNLRGATLWKQRTNPDQQYRLDIQDYVLAATYQPAAFPKLTLDVSYTYERIRDKKAILNESALDPPPIVPLFSTFHFDSNAQIFSGGISCEGLYKELGGRLTSTYARTEEENSQRYSVVSLSFWYKNKWIIPIVTFERYDLDDFERPGDGFSANLVTVSLRKEF